MLTSLTGHLYLAVDQHAEAVERLWSDQFMVNARMNRFAPNRDAVVDLIRQGLIHYSEDEQRIEQLRVAGDVAVVMGAEPFVPLGSRP